MRRPPTQFASVGRERVAFQVFGEGDTVLLFLKSGLASVEMLWEHPGHLRAFRVLGERLRVVMFDHRGLGMSDPVEEHRLGDLDERVEDVLGVLDHLGIERVVIQGELDGGATAVKLAVEHPERCDRLVLTNTLAKGSPGPGYPWGMAWDDEDMLEGIRLAWGRGDLVRSVAAHLGDDRDFLGRFERLGARPGPAAATIRRTAEHDVRDLLPLVACPTLVVHTGDLLSVGREHAVYLVEHIAGAELAEMPASSFYWGGGAMERVMEFTTGTSSARHERDLATVLFTDIVGSTATLQAVGDGRWRQSLDVLDDLVATRVEACRGRVVKQTGDGHVAEFPSPGDAVRAALSLLAGSQVLGLTLRAGIHTGEVERREGGDLGGLTVHVAARVAAAAGADEVLVSRTVADLLGSTTFGFVDRGEHALKGVDGMWRLLAITDEPGP
ncbi:MAG: family 3 adenylate cyclase [Acidimicrobiales bacterium]|nr:family 3 adenylate cyclase [Acidimicrobiales bacterium]